MTTQSNLFRTIVQRQEPDKEDTRSLSQKPKRGRPVNGKRSNEEWVARTFYVRREIDFNLEEQLLAFKRQGREIDKSELIDLLLDGWLNWHKGENIEMCLSDIAPIRKSD